MKKIFTVILLVGMLFIPTKLLAAGNVAKIGSTEYQTLEAALTAAETADVKVVELLTNATGDDLTLKSGIKLIVPEGMTLSLTGDNEVKAGSTILINGTINVDEGVLDASKVTFGTDTGLIKGQDGKIAIKDNGLVVFPDCWGNGTSLGGVKWEPTGSYAAHIFGTHEAGAGIRVSDGTTVKNYVYTASGWKGAVLVSGDDPDQYYTTFAEAVTNAFVGNTIKLLADVHNGATVVISKDLTLNLNGHNLTANRRVLEVPRGTFNITGSGTIKELDPYYSPIVIYGSDVATDTNYTVVNVGKNVTLDGYYGILVTFYGGSAPVTNFGSTSPVAYGVVVNVEGKLIGRADSDGGEGSGFYINGTVQNKTNAPKITIKNTTLEGPGAGVYAAGYGEYKLENVTMTGKNAGYVIKAGKHNLKNVTVKATGNYVENVEGYGNGFNPSGAAIQIEGNAGYAGDIEIVIDGGKYESEKGVVFYEYLASNKTTTSVKSLEIKSGDFFSDDIEYRPTFAVSNSFKSTIKGFIKGGTYYSLEEDSFVAAGYKVYGDYDISRYVVTNVTIPTGTRTISGTITNGDTAVVQLRQGATIIKSVTAEDGVYTITGVAKGLYNVIAINGDNSIMEVVEVKDANVTLDLTIPTAGSSQVIIFGANTPNVIVDGFNTITESNMKIVMVEIVNQTTYGNFEEIVEGIKEEINDTKKDTLFLDISLGGREDFIIETTGMLTVMIPFDLTNKKDVELYRQHLDQIVKLTKLDEKPEVPEDGTYFLDTVNNLVYVYTNKFSLYGFSFTNLANPKTSDNIMTYVLIGLLSMVAIAGSGMYLSKKTVKINR